MSAIYTVTTIPRRWITVGILAFLSFILLYQLDAYRTEPNAMLSSPSAPSYQRPEIQDDGQFHWSHHSQHFPLESFKHLPSGRPNVLPRIQHHFGEESATEVSLRLQRRSEVKATFQRGWNSYRERAWPHDELSPLTGQGRDTFGGWAATLVDSLDTLWIMEMKTEFYEAVAATESINFGTSTDQTINIFETTIRYLGGFLGAYDLSNDRRLLDRAVDVAEMLLVAFDTPNHMPITRWDWKAAAEGQRQDTPTYMLVSELGSLTLEFTRLSQLTGDPKYYDAVDRIMNLFDDQQNKTKLPGMWPVVVDPRTEDLISDTGFTLGGMSDSLYEYLPKQYALLGGLHPSYQKMYEQAMSTAIDSMFFRPMTPDEDDILISGDVGAFGDGISYTTEPKGQHLACFAGGMLGLGGRLFGIGEHVNTGRKITEGCIWAYKSMERRIMPEIAHFIPCESKTACPWSEDKWLEFVLKQHGRGQNTVNAADVVRSQNLPPGFTSIDDTRYILRPEAIESVFYFYRITGDNKYREAAWDMFSAIDNVTRTEYANAAIPDISHPISQTSIQQDDRMESFWFAETLKYFYLIFSEPELISLDDYVLNTEAHPFRRPS